MRFDARFGIIDVIDPVKSHDNYNDSYALRWRPRDSRCYNVYRTLLWCTDVRVLLSYVSTRGGLARSTESNYGMII